MAVWSEVAISDIRPDRCDAEYFKNDYLAIINMLYSTGSCSNLGKLFKIINRGDKADYKEEGLIPVLRSVNIRELGFNNIRQEYVPEEYYDKKTRGHVVRDDIMITSTGTGTLGRTSIWYKNTKAYNVPENSFLREPINIDPYMVAIFLNTDYGIQQLFQHQRGSSGQLHLYPVDIKRVIIPECLFPHQKEIGDYLREAFDLHDQSKSLYNQVQELFEQELELDKLIFEKPVGYEVGISEAVISARFDSEHFFPEFKNMKVLLQKKRELTSLARQLTFCGRGRQPLYTKIGTKVINSKHVLANKVILKGNRFAELNPLETLNIGYGDVIINGTGRGPIGRAAAYLEREASVPDNHITILRCDKLDPVYLAVFLNSKAGKLQVEKYQRGSSGQIELYPFDIKKFLRWDAPSRLQKKIRNLHEKALFAGKESQQLLEQAKNRVEQLIEEAAEKNG